MQKNGKLSHPTLTVLEMPAMPAPSDRAQAENKLLQAENSHLQAENKLLQAENGHLQAENKLLQAEDEPSQAENGRVQAENEPLQARNKHLRGANNLVQARNDLLHGPGDPARANNEAIRVYRANDPIERRFVAARISIETALQDGNIVEALAPYGYNRERLLQGQALVQQAQALAKRQRSSKGVLFAATVARAAAHNQAQAVYSHHVAIARLALQGDRGAAQKLDLSGRKRALAAWLFQAEQFYTNALATPAITAKLARYGITSAQLTAAQQQVAAVAASIVTQQQSKNGASESMQARDAALQALNHWMRDFRAVARMALANQPQRLAQLGL
jgi:hypothetical protein